MKEPNRLKNKKEVIKFRDYFNQGINWLYNPKKANSDEKKFVKEYKESSIEIIAIMFLNNINDLQSITGAWSFKLEDIIDTKQCAVHMQENPNDVYGYIFTYEKLSNQQKKGLADLSVDLMIMKNK